MNVYRRYFKVTTGPLVAAVAEANSINDDAHEEYVKICDELVVADRAYYHRDRTLVGFQPKPDHCFDPALWKKNNRGGFWPKQNTKWGKNLVKRIRAVKTKNVQECLELVGQGHMPTLFGAGHAHYPTLVELPYDAPIFLISVPWYDESPMVLAEYQEQKAKGNHMSHNLDAVLWHPTEDMIEIKHWEYEKLIDEWNETVKK